MKEQCEPWERVLVVVSPRFPPVGGVARQYFSLTGIGDFVSDGKKLQPKPPRIVIVHLMHSTTS